MEANWHIGVAGNCIFVIALSSRIIHGIAFADKLVVAPSPYCLASRPTPRLRGGGMAHMLTIRPCFLHSWGVRRRQRKIYVDGQAMTAWLALVLSVLALAWRAIVKTRGSDLGCRHNEPSMAAACVSRATPVVGDLHGLRGVVELG